MTILAREKRRAVLALTHVTGQLPSDLAHSAQVKKIPVTVSLCGVGFKSLLYRRVQVLPDRSIPLFKGHHLLSLQRFLGWPCYELPNALPFSRRERAGRDLQNATYLAREAVS